MATDICRERFSRKQSCLRQTHDLLGGGCQTINHYYLGEDYINLKIIEYILKPIIE